MYPLSVYENSSEYSSGVIPAFQEVALQQSWKHLPLFRPLELKDETTLLIIDTGQLNDGAGPDFLNAQLLIDGELLLGDVECHLKSRDWYYHGHDNDKKYHRVILHVVVEDNDGPDFPTLILSPVHTPCFAQRKITSSILYNFALVRLRQKSKRFERIKKNHLGLTAYDFGLIEVLVNGPYKKSLLTKLAMEFGFESWPLSLNNWNGSQKSFQAVDRLYLKIQHLFLELITQPMETDTWGNVQKRLTCLTISMPLINEYYLNIWVPRLPIPIESKIEIWQNLKVARHYGIEGKLIHLGILDKIQNAAEQQGSLYFYQRYCRNNHCQDCPLVGYKESITRKIIE
jgi:hypothetical protein